jgi:hypothetical protein
MVESLDILANELKAGEVVSAMKDSKAIGKPALDNYCTCNCYCHYCNCQICNTPYNKN